MRFHPPVPGSGDAGLLRLDVNDDSDASDEEIDQLILELENEVPDSVEPPPRTNRPYRPNLPISHEDNRHQIQLLRNMLLSLQSPQRAQEVAGPTGSSNSTCSNSQSDSTSGRIDESDMDIESVENQLGEDSNSASSKPYDDLDD